MLSFLSRRRNQPRKTTTTTTTTTTTAAEGNATCRGRTMMIVYCVAMMVVLGGWYGQLLTIGYHSVSVEKFHDTVISNGNNNTTANNSSNSNSACTCRSSSPMEWRSQAGQDRFLFKHVFSKQPTLCCGVSNGKTTTTTGGGGDDDEDEDDRGGYFVEFGARNGKIDSNTYAYESGLGWTGMLFEIDPRPLQHLKANRPRSDVIRGAVCPANQTSVRVILSLPGWSGAVDTFEPGRLETAPRRRQRDGRNVTCHHLPTELRNRRRHRVDYMTVDTEGSEWEIVQDFPWDEFDVRVVQIEQLLEAKYPSQKGKKRKIVDHMTSFGYQLLRAYLIYNDTEDLMFVRNLEVPPVLVGT